MSTEDMLFLAIVVASFAAFGVVLYWAEMRSGRGRRTPAE